MTYACIFIVGVSIGNYVGNFQVAVVLILRPSSDFPLIYFKQHSGGHLSTNNLGAVIGFGG
jgi:hypothetical protein